MHLFINERLNEFTDLHPHAILLAHNVDTCLLDLENLLIALAQILSERFLGVLNSIENERLADSSVDWNLLTVRHNLLPCDELGPPVNELCLELGLDFLEVFTQPLVLLHELDVLLHFLVRETDLHLLWLRLLCHRVKCETAKPLSNPQLLNVQKRSQRIGIPVRGIVLLMIFSVVEQNYPE